MKAFVDHAGEALLTEDYEHIIETYEDLDGAKDIDIIKTNSNVWLPATQVMDVMGMNASETKHTGRVADRIDHPDIIKITDTPFRFTDGRRNRGSLVSPRAIMVFNAGKTKGFNAIKANAFVEWMAELVLDGHDVDHWSPAKQQINLIEPVYREITFAKPEDNPELDPLRPVGTYLHLINMLQIEPDEIEFCLCGDAYNGLGKCWCRRKGGVRTYLQEQSALSGQPDSVLDDDDVFISTMESVTFQRIKTVSESRISVAA